LSTGRFDREAMLELLDRDAMANNSRYQVNRCWSTQDWALEDNVPVEEILEYEARFNYLWPNYNGVYVCVYDATKFSAAIMMQMLRTHPHFIIDNVVRENPFYVPPEILLHEIRNKDAGSWTAGQVTLTEGR
jgi:MEDS: MEthanogen/methylotroph, DcmR Sensory domain